MSNLAVDQTPSKWGAAPGTDEGTVVGISADSKVGFFGTEPVNQPDKPTADAASIIAALVALGLVKAA